MNAMADEHSHAVRTKCPNRFLLHRPCVTKLPTWVIMPVFSEGRPFDLICLDIMMPKLDGQTVLKEIRALEAEHSVASGKEAKIIMTTGLNDQRNVVEANPRCDAYLTKPIDRAKLMFYVKKFGILDRRTD
jgi:CheY-like chemotaxis protein